MHFSPLFKWKTGTVPPPPDNCCYVTKLHHRRRRTPPKTFANHSISLITRGKRRRVGGATEHSYMFMHGATMARAKPSTQCSIFCSGNLARGSLL